MYLPCSPKTPHHIKLWYLSRPLFCCPLVLDALAIAFAFAFIFVLVFVPAPLAFRCAIMLLMLWLLPIVLPLPVFAHDGALDCAAGDGMPNDAPEFICECDGGGGIENEEPRDEDCVPSEGRWLPIDMFDMPLLIPPIALFE